MVKLRLRQALIRLSHWEYWPFGLVYIPVYVYWGWLALKARSLFFFNTANPLIRNGGFLMESKKEIYDSMPPALYPATLLVTPGTHPREIVEKLAAHNLAYPLAAKPDIGMRGLRVALLHNADDLRVYTAEAQWDFLVQDFVPHQNEVGIFYCRMPGEPRGIITGIVGKEFLSVRGDGRSTLAQLIEKNSRAVLQQKALQQEYGNGLQRVLPDGEAFTLVPYGNHSRGAKFVDLTSLVDDELLATVDRICQSVPEFYYGRLDVRFCSWEELRKGEAFSVIELNGAGSEPTHIYDPKHSLFFAWKEIMRHLRLLYRISRMNKQRQNLLYMTTAEGLSMLRANRRHVALLSAPKTDAGVTKENAATNQITQTSRPAFASPHYRRSG